MNELAVSIEGLCVMYGSTIAVENLSFNFRRGEIYGLLGPNGAGKSSTLKVLAGILEPNHGKVEVFGKPITEEIEVKKLIGYVPEETVLLESLTPREFFEFIASIGGLSEEINSRLSRLVSAFELNEYFDSPIATLSMGTKRKVAVIAALLHEPPLLGIGTNLPIIVGFLAGVSLLSLTATPTLFSAETLASAYMKSLPLKKRTLVIAKTTLSTLTYFGCVIALAIGALYVGRDIFSVIAFGLAQALSVAAGCMTELLLLIRKFWDKELEYSNIYANLSTFIVVLTPGIIICLVPTAACFIVSFVNIQLAITVFFASAAAEFVAITSLTSMVIKN